MIELEERQGLIMKKLAIAIVAAMSLGVLAGCGGGGAGAGRTVEVMAGEGGTMAFNPKTIDATKGEKITVHFVNKDSAQAHSFIIKDLNVKSEQVQPGKDSTVTFTVDKTVEFYCDVPGHKDGGMVGSINVK
jgi:uncharacterized cupredoxin-like copper-binding protein